MDLGLPSGLFVFSVSELQHGGGGGGGGCFEMFNK